MSAAPAESVDLLVTPRGHERLRAELAALCTDGRRQLAGQLQEARSGNDLADTTVLHGLLEEQVQLEQRIATLEAQIAVARVVEPPTDGTAGIGSVVRVRDGATGEIAEYELVGSIEADLGADRVSAEAPVGRALVGRRRGDAVEVSTPRGPRSLEVLDVRPGPGGDGRA